MPRIPYRYREHVVSLGMLLAGLAVVALIAFSVMYYANKSEQCSEDGGALVRGAFGYVCVDKR